MRKHRVLILLACSVLFILACECLGFCRTISLASAAEDGAEANNWSFYPSLSANGRYIAFTSDSTNLVNGISVTGQVYVRDRLIGSIRLASVASDGTKANGFSSDAAISADGEYVAFVSDAENLVAGIVTDGQIYVHDMTTGRTEVVSTGVDGVAGDGWSFFPAISADGRYIAFESESSNLVAGAGDSGIQIYVHDRSDGSTRVASIAEDGTVGDGFSSDSSISADGRYVAFHSDSTNLVAGVDDGTDQIYVHDRQTGKTEIVSVSSDGTAGNDGSYYPSLSEDGRFVAFQSEATNLASGVHQGVYIHDRVTGTTDLISPDACKPSINGDGRFVAYISILGSQSTYAPDSHWQICVVDRSTGVQQTVSTSIDGIQGNLGSDYPVISADGEFVAFDSSSTNLLGGVTDGVVQVFACDTGSVVPFLGLTSNGMINCSTDLNSWCQVPGYLEQLNMGDVDGDGRYDLVGLSTGGSIWCSTDYTNWRRVPGTLKSMALGCFDGSGRQGVAGLSANGSIWYTADLESWTRVPGALNRLVAGYFAGNGKAGLAGLTANGSVWYTADLATWHQIPGCLADIKVGDIGGQGKDGLVGLSTDGSIWCTEDLSSWTRVPGYLAQLAIGDLDGDGKDDIAGLSTDGSIWYTTDRGHWTKIPGSMKTLISCDLTRNGRDSLVGLSSTGSVWYTTDLHTWTNAHGNLASLCPPAR